MTIADFLIQFKGGDAKRINLGNQTLLSMGGDSFLSLIY